MREAYERELADRDRLPRPLLRFTGSTREFIELLLPLLRDPRLRAGEKDKLEPKLRALCSLIEVCPDGSPRSFLTLLDAMRKAVENMD